MRKRLSLRGEKRLHHPIKVIDSLFINNITKQKEPGAVKKGRGQNQRIIWLLRWLVRTRADVSLQPSG